MRVDKTFDPLAIVISISYVPRYILNKTMLLDTSFNNDLFYFPFRAAYIFGTPSRRLQWLSRLDENYDDGYFMMMMKWTLHKTHLWEEPSWRLPINRRIPYTILHHITSHHTISHQLSQHSNSWHRISYFISSSLDFLLVSTSSRLSFGSLLCRCRCVTVGHKGFQFLKEGRWDLVNVEFRLVFSHILGEGCRALVVDLHNEFSQILLGEGIQALGKGSLLV